ncbi:MAG: C1 family peptidase [bacterium]
MGRPIQAILPVLGLLLAAGCTLGGSGDADGNFTANGNGPLLAQSEELQPAPGYEDGSVVWEPASESVVNVGVQPDQPLSPGDGRMTSSVGSVPWSEPQAGPGHSSGLECDALAPYAQSNAGPSEVQGLTFDPNGGSAWACFELKTDASLPTSVAVAWYSLPLDFGSYYIGIGDRATSQWRWFRGPDDGVLSFDASALSLGDSALVCVLLEGSQQADLWKLRWGVSEVRGTGLMPDNDPGRGASSWSAGKSASATLPASVDLNHYAPWVHNQGSFGSCTAFACNDTAFGIMLARTYGSEGWDSTTTANSTSPLYSYVNSGKPPVANTTFNPLCAGSSGRYMSDAFEVLELLGTPTESAAPYTTATDCSQAFSQQAQDEATLIRIDDWYWLNSTGSQLVTDIKTILATDTPVPMATYGLENSLLYYSGGVYEFGGTSGLSGGHAMCIVGYDDSIQAFDIRNQWGGNWGAGGHVWFSYSSVAQMSQLGRFYAYYMDVSHSAALSAHFLGGSSQPEDFGEPNDSQQAALQLAGFPFEQQMTLGYNGDELDWLKFSYSAGQSTTFTFTSNPVQLILGVELVDAAGNVLADSYLAGGTQTISGSWSSNGTAWIHIQPTYGTGAYEITAVATSAPAVPQGLTAAANTQVGYGVDLSWQASEGAESYSVQRSTASSGPFTEVGSSYSTQYFDFSASEYGTYWYRLIASGPGGVSSPGSVVSAELGLPQVTGLTASQGSSSEHVALSWQAVAGAEQYQLYRGTGNMLLPLRRVEGLNFIDGSAQKGVHYSYRVAALQGELQGPRSEKAEGWRSGSQVIVQGELRPDGGEEHVVPSEGVDNAADGVVRPDGGDGPKLKIK